ncbi:MAG TPA: hypothetical protein VHS55_06440 [Solirubrobacteraceae bacterium]|jgi:hypothetical protein|nr:hypothetical protein [Solirubrobacteraceae bacterium]
MKRMRKVQLAAATVIVALWLGVGMTGSALATGQPGASAGNECKKTESALVTPGKASEARGSVFNPEGVAGEHYAGNPETASLEHSKSGKAVSQYDVACVNATRRASR